MSEKNTGGQAFPLPCSASPMGGVHWGEEGMTLRDYYAGEALVGIISEVVAEGEYPTSRVVIARWKKEDELPEEYIATAAFKIADAMIKARGVE